MKALFIGLGGVGQRHLRNLLSLRPDCQIGAVRHKGRSFEIGSDLKPDYSVDIMTKYHIQGFDNLDQAIDWQPDIAIVASPSSKHVWSALPLLRANIPTFIEKPVADNQTDAELLLQAAKNSNTLGVAGFVFQFHPATRKVSEWLAKDALGKLSSAQIVCHNFLPFIHSYEKMEEFYIGRKDLGGGAILSEIHSLEILTRFFGYPEKIMALGGRRGSFPCDVEDTASALCLCPGGLPVSLHISIVEYPPERSLTIHGEKGLIRWEPLANRAILINRQAGTEERVEVPNFNFNQLFIEAMAEFLDCRAENKESINSLANCHNAQRLAEAMLSQVER